MARMEHIEYVILSSRGDQSFAYTEDEMRRTVGMMLTAPKTRVEGERVVKVLGNAKEYRPCEYTHSHTQYFCGNPGCREH